MARALKATQKTAWFMLHRIRLAMETEQFDFMQGVVEIDEGYIDGKWENKPLKVRRNAKARENPWEFKTQVLGIVERGGRVRAFVVPSGRKKRPLPELVKSIYPDATVYTDQSTVYTHINEYFLTHSTVNHSIYEYVRDNVHTNNIECLWSLLKRTIGGTYTHVNPRHLDRCLAEQGFRFDERENTDSRRFVKVLKRTEGKRLTYKVLKAKK